MKGINKLHILLDNGHGNNTAGKRSPIWEDGEQLFEWELNRSIVQRLVKRLNADGIPCHIIVPEDEDISLAERCRRANNIAKQYGKENCLFLSVHSNASANGQAKGIEIYTSKGNTKSDAYAEIFFKVGKEMFPKAKFRYDIKDGDHDKEENFYVLRNTICPAVLPEAFFYDNEEECRFLMSDEGREQIAEWYYKAILECANIA